MFGTCVAGNQHEPEPPYRICAVCDYDPNPICDICEEPVYQDDAFNEDDGRGTHWTCVPADLR